MEHSDFFGLLPECCRLGFASIEECHGDERTQIEACLPEVRTVMVIARHVTHSLEWVWFRFSGDRAGETCSADLHVKSMVERICHRLGAEGHRNVLLPYPGQCGLMFKTLAVKTGLGQLGDNYLFMNGDWGPWIHLRVVLTNAPIATEEPGHQEACNHCGKCMAAGPIRPDDFDGMRCRDKMREIRAALGDVPTIFECERCLRACPVGASPQEVLVSHRRQAS